MTDGNLGTTGTEDSQPVAPDRLARYEADARSLATGDHGRLVVRHARASAVLAEIGEDRIARGAAMSAAVEALRLVATPARSAQDFDVKCAALRDFVATIVDATRRDDLSSLLDAGLSVEAEMRMIAGLPMQGHRLGGWLTSSLEGRTQASAGTGFAVLRADDIDTSDLALYATAASAGDVDHALADATQVLSDVIVLRKRGASTEGAWNWLERIAFSLCARPWGSLLAWHEDRSTLGILMRTLEGRRPLAAEILRVRLERGDRRAADIQRGET